MATSKKGGRKAKTEATELLPPLAQGETVAITERLELVPVAELIPYARNARTHSQEQIRALQASIREYGFVSPVVIDAQRGIVAGHGRVLAAQAMGMECVPCVYAEHLTEAQKRSYLLADNRLAEMAGWDKGMVLAELEELQELGADTICTGFVLEELKLPDRADKETVRESSTRSKKLVTCPECGCEFSPTRRRK